MTSFRTGPDARGLFGRFGGQFVAETLMPLINQLAAEYEKAKTDPAFLEELAYFQRDYIGRASPLYFAERLTEHFGGAKIYLKREDLNHTGAHKINNCIGQILLAKRMGKTRIIAETGAGQHGVATATAAALLGLDCTIYMGAEDTERQALNVARMRILGADFIAAFDQRIINTHPALLPAFPGAHGVRDALAYGVTVTGSTAHLVDSGVDTGPIIEQRTVAIAPDDTEETLHERIKAAERELLVDTVAQLSRG